MQEDWSQHLRGAESAADQAELRRNDGLTRTLAERQRISQVPAGELVRPATVPPGRTPQQSDAAHITAGWS